jgi:CBS domain-containing membrane protein
VTWWKRFLPEQVSTTYLERFRASVGVFVGIAFTGVVSTLWAGSPSEIPLLIAPMGASAILLFGVPASPLAQPWSMIGGNLLAAAIGVMSAHSIGSPLLATAVAVTGSFAAMSLLRCIHPPSGAVALTAVLGGSHIMAAGYSFVAVPVALNSVLLTVAALAYNNLTGRSYPHRSHEPMHPHPPVSQLQLTSADIDEVLTDYGEALDISRDDLHKLFRELLGRAQRRALFRMFEK